MIEATVRPAALPSAETLDGLLRELAAAAERAVLATGPGGELVVLAEWTACDAYETRGAYTPWLYRSHLLMFTPACLASADQVQYLDKPRSRGRQMASEWLLREMRSAATDNSLREAEKRAERRHPAPGDDLLERLAFILDVGEHDLTADGVALKTHLPGCDAPWRSVTVSLAEMRTVYQILAERAGRAVGPRSPVEQQDGRGER